MVLPPRSSGWRRWKRCGIAQSSCTRILLAAVCPVGRNVRPTCVLAQAANPSWGAEQLGGDSDVEEDDELGIPAGWRQCPPMSTSIIGPFIALKVPSCEEQVPDSLLLLASLPSPATARRCRPATRPQVPLGHQFDQTDERRRGIEPGHTFHVENAAERAAKLVALKDEKMRLRLKEHRRRECEKAGQVFDEAAYAEAEAKEPPLAKLSLVIDLTKSRRYYDAGLWKEQGIRYIKVRGTSVMFINLGHHLVRRGRARQERGSGRGPLLAPHACKGQQLSHKHA